MSIIRTLFDREPVMAIFAVLTALLVVVATTLLDIDVADVTGLAATILAGAVAARSRVSPVSKP